MQAASRAVSTECYMAGVPRSNQVLLVGMAMSFYMYSSHHHSEGPWHFGIVAVRHVAQASCLFLVLSCWLLLMGGMSISAYSKWVDEGPILRADLVPVLS